MFRYGHLATGWKAWFLARSNQDGDAFGTWSVHFLKAVLFLVPTLASKTIHPYIYIYIHT